MKRFLLSLLIAISLSWIAWIRTDGFFSPSLIQAELCTNASPAEPLVLNILSQPFEYFRKGRQCFVFHSGDQRYVLKFFNRKYFQMPWYAFLFKNKEMEKRSIRRHFYENSYQIAHREFGEEILFLHMGFSHDLPTVLVRDRASRTFSINLNQVPFVLQKKGRPFYESLHAICQKEGMEGLYREIDAWIAAIATRISKQIADADSDVEHNWGYADGHLFHLDPGRLYYDPRLKEIERQRQEWHTAAHRFIKWLRDCYPAAAEYFENNAYK